MARVPVHYEVGEGLPLELHAHITRTVPSIVISRLTRVYMWRGYTVVCTDVESVRGRGRGLCDQYVRLFPARWPICSDEFIGDPPKQYTDTVVDAAMRTATFMLLTTTRSFERGLSRAAMDALFATPQLRDRVRHGIHAWVQRSERGRYCTDLVDLTHVLPRGLREIGQRIGSSREMALFVRTRTRAGSYARRRTHMRNPATVVILWNCHVRMCARSRIRGLYQQSTLSDIMQDTGNGPSAVMTRSGIVNTYLFYVIRHAHMCLHDATTN